MVSIATSAYTARATTWLSFLAADAGGGHHIVTKRRLMLEYAIKGMYPLVPLIVSTTPDTYYLKGQSTSYPTAVLDFDGNERASVHLRDSDLNLLHIMLQQLQRNDLSPPIRKAVTDAFFATINRRRAGWEKGCSGYHSRAGSIASQYREAAETVRRAAEEIHKGGPGQRTRRRREKSFSATTKMDKAGTTLHRLRRNA